jgi:hypothetical protein
MTSYDPAGHDAVHALIEEFAQVARGLHVSGDFEESLHRITATAVVAIGGCESASISLLNKTDPVTWGATDQFALDGDQIGCRASSPKATFARVAGASSRQAAAPSCCADELLDNRGEPELARKSAVDPSLRTGARKVSKGLSRGQQIDASR